MSILSSLLGITRGEPTQTIPTGVQTQEIAKEVAPFIKDILGKGQALYKQRMEEGFVPFEGKTLADVTAEQQQAQEGIRGLVGTQAPAFEEARGLVRGTTAKPTAEGLQEFMSPYQQAVIDVEKRRAQEAFERDTLPKVRQAQIASGAFGGTRGTLLEALALQDQARLLSDIEARGQQQAFESAQRAFEAQKQREAQAAQGLSGLAQTQFGQATRELGQLEAVGREQQQREQQLLDESYQRFLRERAFPEQQLAQYQGVVTGASPLIGATRTVRSPQQFQPSPLAQALGTATGVANIYGAFSNPAFNPISSPKLSKEGGQVVPAKEGTEGGLSVLIKMIKKKPGVQQKDVTEMLDVFEEGGLPMIKRQQNNQVMTKQDRIRQIMQDLGSITGVSDVGTEEYLLSEEREASPTLLETLTDYRAGRKGTVEKRKEEIKKEDAEKIANLIVDQDAQQTPNVTDDNIVTDTGADANTSNFMTRLLTQLASGLPTVDKTEAYKSLQKAIEGDPDRTQELYDRMMADKAFQKRQALTAGLTKGLLAPKTGRGGIAADVQQGILESTQQLLKTGSNKDLINFILQQDKDQRKSAILGAKTVLDSLKDAENIGIKNYQNKLAVLSEVAKLEQLGLKLDAEQLSRFIDQSNAIVAGTTKDAEALRDSGILQRTFKNPVILQRLNEIIKDKIEGKQGTATTGKGKGTFEVKPQEKS